MGRRSDIDWQAVRREWETTNASDRDIATKHGVSHTTIARRATAEGWTKDLTEDVRRGVQAAVWKGNAPINAPTGAFDRGTHQTVVQSVVKDVVAHVQRHIAIADRTLRVGEKLMNEIESMCDAPGFAEALEAALAANGSDDAEVGKMLLKAVRKAASLPQRATAFQRTQNATDSAVAMVRTALGLDEKKERDKDAPREPAILNFGGAPAPARPSIGSGREQTPVVH